MVTISDGGRGGQAVEHIMTVFNARDLHKFIAAQGSRDVFMCSFPSPGLSSLPRL